MGYRKFNEKWEKCKLYDLATWKNGLAFKKISFSNKGYPIIKIAELKNGITKQTNYTNQKYDKDVFLNYDDLIFSWSGNPETSIDAFLYRLPDGYLNQHSFKVTPKEGIDKYFLYYILKYLKPVFKSIATNKQTTGLGHVTIENLKELNVAIPDYIIQRKILKILKNIDDKIELNNLINNNLNKILTTLYKESLNKIKGNEENTLDKFCNIFTGKKNANEYDETGTNKFFTCGDKTLKINSYIYNGPAIIISGNGSYTGRTQFYNGKFDLYQRTYACTIKNNVNEDYIYALYVIVQNELVNKISGGTHGSAIPYIVINDLAKFKIYFDEESLKKLSTQAKKILEKIQSNEEENETLMQIREILLPKLMNGAIDLDNIEI